MYPVDLPPVNDAELTSASENYLATLKATPSKHEWLLTSKKVGQRRLILLLTSFYLNRPILYFNIVFFLLHTITFLSDIYVILKYLSEWVSD